MCNFCMGSVYDVSLVRCIMTERELAYSLATSALARKIVNEMGGVTLGGITLSEKYAEHMYGSCPNSIQEIDRGAMAIRHWVWSVGYDKNMRYTVTMK